SSTRRSDVLQPRNEVDLLADGGGDVGNVLGDDTLHEDLDGPLSFKRKPKHGIFSQPARFLSAFAGSRQDGAQQARATTPDLSAPLATPLGGGGGRRSPQRGALAVHPNQNTKN